MNFMKLRWFFLLSITFFAFTVACSKDNKDEEDVYEYYENEEGSVDVLLTFDTFKTKVKALKIDGFTLVSVTANEDGSKEYEARYVNKDGKYLFVKIGELATSEPVWLDPENTYLLDDRKSEYANTTLIHGLTIHLPQIEAEMAVHSTIDLGKTSFESIARKSGFLAVAPVTVAWPIGIPENHKFKGWLLQVDLGSYDEMPGFTKQMFAVMMLNDELADSYKDAYNSYYDNSTNHIVFPNGTYLVVPDENLYNSDNLYDSYGRYDRIEFMYYIP